jgi:hypothetical protein
MSEDMNNFLFGAIAGAFFGMALAGLIVKPLLKRAP